MSVSVVRLLFCGGVAFFALSAAENVISKEMQFFGNSVCSPIAYTEHYPDPYDPPDYIVIIEAAAKLQPLIF